ncbi:GGDEF domain-containing protein [Piscinibacter sakaiensis]|uniref:diguanylate cyclase n=1 Tax=Piscinibacter sakaiensis TaxID=1547922 RepID=A0A0K8P3Q3_PISS1|nr:GGDEF domain-containing protein [Piscinibacter sakaiensis]GAP37242.1 diguanylate cyclase/phosphodiesterase with PAS/PAC sensor(s) [Piscinibacter sakaiensis]
MTEDLTVALPSPDVTVLRDAEQGQRPCLIFYSGSDAGRRHDLDPGRHLIGRCAEARIVFDQPGISRRHAELEVRPGEVLLRDLGSANRTRVNGEFVEAPRALRQGDLVQLANVVLRYHDGNSLDALLHDRIYRMATTDAGTGAFNRRYLQENLEREVARARRGRQPLSAIGFDLDHFKRVNDGHGHPAGDALLHDCVQRVQQALRGGDLLCRVGGEEFVALLPDTGLAAARALAERLRRCVEAEPFDLRSDPGGHGPWYAQTVSLGVAELEPGMAGGTALLALVDHRLYKAKHQGRNRVVAD